MDERKNQIMQEMAETMLNEDLLPDIFWGEVVYRIIYILNREWMRVRNTKTPYELWKGRETITNISMCLEAIDLLR